MVLVAQVGVFIGQGSIAVVVVMVLVAQVGVFIG